VKKTIKKRAGRAAVAGTTLLGLTAAGLAFAAPASAAQGDGMITGPLSTTVYAGMANPLKSTGLVFDLLAAAELPARVADGSVALWTYPGKGEVGQISLDGKCLVGAAGTGPLNNTMAPCDDSAIAQKWFGSTGTKFTLHNRSATGRALFADVNTLKSQTIDDVSWYTDFAYGLQVSDELAQVAPSLTSPLPNSEITPGTVFTGQAEQNTVITVLDKDGKLIGRATAGADKTWSLTLDPVPINGTHELTIVALGTDGKSVPLAKGDYTMMQSDEARGYTGPAAGAEITPDTVFTGTGAKGETVVIKDGAGNVLGTTTVGNDGQWSLTLNPVPTNGDVNLVVEITGADEITEQLADTNLVMTGSEEPNAYTGPKAGETITPDTVFTGTGTKGETVTITDAQGTVLGSTTIGADGQWSLTLDPAPINGTHELTVTIGDETVANPSVTMTDSDEAPAYSGPQSGDTITPDTVFTGTGGKGETVVIKDAQGNVLGTTTVGNDGQWSLTLDPAPINGDVSLVIEINGEKVADVDVTMTGSDEAPAYSGPADGATITPDTVFTGTGGKGETVVITDGAGNVLGETTVGDDGQWSLTLDPAPKNGDVNLIVTVGDKKVADTNVTMTGSDEERALTSPAAGTAITPDTVFSGTGNIGDKVEIKDKNGTVLGSAEVGADGTWSTTLSPVPNNGSTDLVIEITGMDGKTETLADNTYEMTESTTKFEVLTPDLAKDSGAIKNGTVFTGKGEPGSTVVIMDKDGNTVGNAEVDDQGNWSAPLSGLTDGPNNLTISYTAPGEEPVSNNLGGIVVVSDDESTPLMDPAIAGGAGLALLAAAGAFIGIRRRRTTSTN